jgi:hypothetical protein
LQASRQKEYGKAPDPYHAWTCGSPGHDDKLTRSRLAPPDGCRSQHRHQPPSRRGITGYVMTQQRAQHTGSGRLGLWPGLPRHAHAARRAVWLKPRRGSRFRPPRRDPGLLARLAAARSSPRVVRWPPSPRLGVPPSDGSRARQQDETSPAGRSL